MLRNITILSLSVLLTSACGRTDSPRPRADASGLVEADALAALDTAPDGAPDAGADALGVDSGTVDSGGSEAATSAPLDGGNDGGFHPCVATDLEAAPADGFSVSMGKCVSVTTINYDNSTGAKAADISATTLLHSASGGDKTECSIQITRGDGSVLPWSIATGTNSGSMSLNASGTETLANGSNSWTLQLCASKGTYSCNLLLDMGESAILRVRTMCP